MDIVGVPSLRFSLASGDPAYTGGLNTASAGSSPLASKPAATLRFSSKRSSRHQKEFCIYSSQWLYLHISPGANLFTGRCRTPHQNRSMDRA